MKGKHADVWVNSPKLQQGEPGVDHQVIGCSEAFSLQTPNLASETLSHVPILGIHTLLPNNKGKHLCFTFQVLIMNQRRKIVDFNA